MSTEKALSSKIKHRVDTLENWNQSNPVLLSGELALYFDSDYLCIKVGDGTKNFADLDTSYVPLKSLGSMAFQNAEDFIKTIDIGTVKTVEYGNSASASFTPTDDGVLLNLVIPAGRGGGLNSVYRGDSPPEDTTLIYINTESNISYYHNGTDWVPIAAVWT